MPDFDPDAYLAEKTKGQKQPFDPDTYLQEKLAPITAKPEGFDVGGASDALMRGASQGFLAGFPDEAYGVVGAFANPTNSDKGFLEGFSERYHQSRDYARLRDAKAQEKHGGAFTAGQIGGSVATAFAPGLGALNASKGAGLIEAVGKGAMQGGLAGAGNAAEITDVPGEAGRGAAFGAATGGAFNVGGRVVGAVADKLKPAKVGAVLLNAPEGALERYIKSPEAVNAARSRAEIVSDTFLPRLDKLQGEVVSGSQASRAILDQEGHFVSGDKIAEILEGKAKQIVDRAEGVLDDPSQVATVKWLEDTASKYRSVIPDDVSNELGAVVGKDAKAMAADKARMLSTNRVKDLIQTIDRTTEYSTGPGQFSRLDDIIKKDIRSKVDDILKSNSSAYAQQMKHVAEDTMILKEVSELAKSPQGFDNLLKRTQRGATPHLMDAIKSFDERTGGGLLKELEDSAAKDALNGNLGSTVGEAIGGFPGKIVGKTIGFLGGATVDKYGPQMARGIVDSAAKLDAYMASSQGIQTLGKYGKPLLDAAAKGNQSLAATHAYLFATDQNYRKILEDNAVKRRMQTNGRP